MFALGLSQWSKVFEKEQITMDILVEMGHEELRAIGITAYGHRHKIIKRIEKVLANRGLSYFCF